MVRSRRDVPIEPSPVFNPMMNDGQPLMGGLPMNLQNQQQQQQMQQQQQHPFQLTVSLLVSVCR